MLEVILRIPIIPNGTISILGIGSNNSKNSYWNYSKS